MYRVVDGRDGNAEARERHDRRLDVVPALENSLVAEDRRQAVEHVAQLQLLGACGAVEIEAAAGTVPDGDVACLLRLHRQRDTDNVGAHRLGVGAFDVKREKSLVARRRYPGVERFEREDRLVLCSLQRLAHRRFFPDRAERSACRLGVAARWRGECHFLLARQLCRRDFPGVLDLVSCGDALGQRRKLEPAQECDQFLDVRLGDSEVRERLLDRNVILECDELAAEARLIGKLDETLTAFGLLDGVRARQQRVEIPELVDQLRCGLDANAGNARHIVDAVAHQRLNIDHLIRRHTELFDDLRATDAAILHRVEERDLVGDELHQILVRGNDGNACASLFGLPRIGRDEVVGFVAAHLDARNVEGAHRFPDQRKLRNEVFRHIRPVGLIFRVQLVAERVFAFVEDAGDVRRTLTLLGVLQELPEHVAEPGDGADGQPITFARQRRQRVVGAEDVARAVDQGDAVAGLNAGRGSCGAAGRACAIQLAALSGR